MKDKKKAAKAGGKQGEEAKVEEGSDPAKAEGASDPTKSE